MSKIKKVAAMLLICVMVLTMAACGNGSKQGETTKDAGATQGTTANKETTEKKKDVTLEVWSFFSPGTEQSKTYENLAAKFTEENPHIKVDMQFVGQDIVTKLRPRFQQKDTPDIIVNNSMNFEVFAKDGLLHPITSEFDGMDYNGTGVWKDSFISGTLDTGLVDGEYYAVPEQLVITSWFYNKDMFAQYNLEIPKNWSEFINICETLKANDIAPIAQDGNVDFYLAWFYSNIASRVAGYDKWMDTLDRKDGTSWNDPDFIKAASLLQDILPYFQKGFKGTQYPAANAIFVQGKAAMMYIGSWLPQEVKEIMPDDFKMGMFEFPFIEDGKETRKLVEAKTNGYVIPKEAKNKEEAVLFLKFLSTKESTEVISQLNIHPVIQGVDAPEILKDVQGIMEGADIVTPQYIHLQNAAYKDWAASVIYPLNASFMFGDIATPEEYMRQVEEKTVEFFKNK